MSRASSRGHDAENSDEEDMLAVQLADARDQVGKLVRVLIAVLLLWLRSLRACGVVAMTWRVNGLRIADSVVRSAHCRPWH